jgi:aminocarboxymuconate-semialdehyde decarboxylase
VFAADAHAHVIVPELLAEPWGPRVRREDGRQVIELDGRAIRSAIDEFVDLDAIIATQAQRGIDHTVLCPWVALLSGDQQRCRVLNDGLARLRARDPERVSVLGAVPLGDPPAAAAELERIMSTGAFVGVEVTASVGGAYLGDARFEPFWAAAEATSALVFVHPTTRGFADAVFERHYLWNLVGNPFETTIAAADLVMSGTMERHPGLRVLLAHAGGAIVALRGRLRHGHRAVAAAGPELRVSPQELVGRFLFDTVTHDPALLRSLVDLVGAHRVLLGSDYPFDMADADAVGTVRAAGLSPADERAVLGTNATLLLEGAHA